MIEIKQQFPFTFPLNRIEISEFHVRKSYVIPNVRIIFLPLSLLFEIHNLYAKFNGSAKTYVKQIIFTTNIQLRN